jgi:glycosyltransferase involved in cell wall biosynthesis
MKVGIFLGNIWPRDGGGYTFVRDLLAALHRGRDTYDHELVLYYQRGGESLVRSFPGFPNVNIDSRKADVLLLIDRLVKYFPKSVERALRGHTTRWYDRIFAEDGIQFVLLSPWSPPAMETPFATIVWDLQHRSSPWFPEVSSRGEWENRESRLAPLFRRASLIFTGTQVGREEIACYYQVPLERIKVLPFPTPTFAVAGADTPRNPDVLRRLGVPPDYLFYPAQFWAHKNHVVLLSACKRIREKTGWDVGVVFTGGGKSNPHYVRKTARDLGLEHRTVFLNFVDQSDLVQLYKGAFCLVYPTYFGPDNLPPLEAFALECPVVASAIPGALEQMEDAAILFPPADEEALIDAILGLRDPDKRAQIIRAGRHRALKRNWDDYAQAVVDNLCEFARIRRAWP